MRWVLGMDTETQGPHKFSRVPVTFCSSVISNYTFLLHEKWLGHEDCTTDPDSMHWVLIYCRVGQKKSKPDYNCKNFLYCQPTFIMFGTYTIYTLYETCNWRIIVSPPNTVCVTTLPCKILITTLFMFTCIKQSTYYGDSNNWQFLLKFHENNNFKRIVSDEYYLFMISG